MERGYRRKGKWLRCGSDMIQTQFRYSSDTIQIRLQKQPYLNYMSYPDYMSYPGYMSYPSYLNYSGYMPYLSLPSRSR